MTENRPVNIYCYIWLLLIVITFLAYTPGLSGGFLFDDFINLREIGRAGGVDNWETFRTYISSGFSGPTGRPISLITFLADSRYWPADPFSFKLTNVLLHLLAGTLLWRLTRLLLQQLQPKADAQWIEKVAILSAAMWLTHPFMLSTTLYVVQRMTQLAAIFAFAAIWVYLIGRSKIGENNRQAYAYMTVGVVLGTLLALFSKENGVLVPALILVIEFILSKPNEKKINTYWKIIFLIIPSVAIIAYLGTKIDISDRPWITREFNQPERLLTQSRILFDYLEKIFLPRIEVHGLIQDDIIISKIFWKPITTIISVLGILFLIALSIIKSSKYKILSLSILFFLAGHLIESTILGLELYFEHRNYLPAAFLFLPLSAFIFHKKNKFSEKIKISSAFIVCTLLLILLNQRAILWSNTQNLESYWSIDRPYSVRAHNNIVKKLLIEGRITDAKNHLMHAVELIPESAVLRLLLILCQMGEGTATPEEFQALAHFMKQARFDTQVFAGLQTVSDKVRNEPVYPPYAHGMLKVMEGASQNPDAQFLPYLLQITSYSKMQLLMALKNWDAAEKQFQNLISETENPDTAFYLLLEVIKYRQHQMALNAIPRVKEIYAKQKIKNKDFSPDFENEINEIESKLVEDLAKENKISK